MAFDAPRFLVSEWVIGNQFDRAMSARTTRPAPPGTWAVRAGAAAAGENLI